MADKVIQLMSEDGLDYLYPKGVQQIGPNFIKFTNGVMFEWGKVVIAHTCTKAWGNFYETSGKVSFGNFPEPFISGCTPVTILRCFTANVSFTETIESSNTEIANTWIYRPKSGSDLSTNFVYFSIGRWKE